MYTIRNRSLDNFINDYNSFLWTEIKRSNLNLSPKIEANYRRNYHEGEVSPVTSTIFYLYFIHFFPPLSLFLFMDLFFPVDFYDNFFL